MDNLKRRGWTLVNKCFLCKGEEESCDHIIFHCSKASLLWQLVFSLFGVVGCCLPQSKQCFIVSIADPLGRGTKGLLIMLSFQIKN